jgi:hypothetical protein
MSRCFFLIELKAADGKGRHLNFKLFFADGGERVYRIDGCTEDR